MATRKPIRFRAAALGSLLLVGAVACAGTAQNGANRFPNLPMPVPGGPEAVQGWLGAPVDIDEAGVVQSVGAVSPCQRYIRAVVHNVEPGTVIEAQSFAAASASVPSTLLLGAHLAAQASGRSDLVLAPDLYVSAEVTDQTAFWRCCLAAGCGDAWVAGVYRGQLVRREQAGGSFQAGYEGAGIEATTGEQARIAGSGLWSVLVLRPTAKAQQPEGR